MKAPKPVSDTIPSPSEQPPQAEKLLDTKELQYACTKLNMYTNVRVKTRLDIADSRDTELAEFLLKAEEGYFQSLKNKVAAIIQGATRIG